MSLLNWYDEFTSNSPLYKRLYIGFGPSQVETLVEKDPGIFGIGSEEVIKLEWSQGDYRYESYVKYENFPFSPKVFYFKVGKSVVDFLENLKVLTSNCTSDSIKVFFKEYPHTYNVMKANFIDDRMFRWECNYLFTEAICKKENLFDKVREYTYHIDGFISEISNMQLDTSCLKRQEPIVDLSGLDIKIPKWLKIAATVGAVIAVKIIVKSIGQDFELNIDTEGNASGADMNFDTNFDTNFDANYEMEMDTNVDMNSDYTPETFGYLGEQYNIPFGAETITVHQEGNLSRTITLNVEKVTGKSHTWNVIKDGKIIATIKSLNNGKFYIPGFGTGVL